MQLRFVRKDTDPVPLAACPVGLAVCMLRLEVRVSGMEFEKVRIGTVKVPQGLLKCHRIDFLQPRRLLPLLEIGEQPARLNIGHGLMVRLPLVTADGEKMVVHEAGAAERPLDETGLRLVRIDAELVSERVRFHILTSFAMFSGFRCTL